MKTTFIQCFIILFFLITSCVKQNVTPITNNNQVVIPPYNGPTDSVKNLVKQTWLVTQYRVGQMGQLMQVNDSLKFISVANYTYNSFASTYSLYPTGSVYNLTLNYTPWGNLSGSINDYNLSAGSILGNKFTDISNGTSNGSEYYLWIKKIN